MDETRINRKQSEAQMVIRAQQDPAFRQELMADPKGTIAREMGISLPESVTVEVVEETPSTVYLVLPRTVTHPGTQLSDAELETIAGGGWTLADECGNTSWSLDECTYIPGGR